METDTNSHRHQLKISEYQDYDEINKNLMLASNNESENVNDQCSYSSKAGHSDSDNDSRFSQDSKVKFE